MFIIITNIIVAVCWCSGVVAVLMFHVLSHTSYLSPMAAVFQCSEIDSDVLRTSAVQ